MRAFGGDSSPATQAELQGMVDTMLAVSFTLLREVRDFDEMPDVADDLFLLGLKCLTYAPHLLLTPNNLPPLVNCALAGMLVQVSRPLPSLRCPSGWE